MFYQVGLLPVTNNLLDISSDIYMIVQGMIRSDRLKISGSCVTLLLSLGGKRTNLNIRDHQNKLISLQISGSEY